MTPFHDKVMAAVRRRRIEGGERPLGPGEQPGRLEIYNALTQLASERGREVKAYRERTGHRVTLFILNPEFDLAPAPAGDSGDGGGAANAVAADPEAEIPAGAPGHVL